MKIGFSGFSDDLVCVDMENGSMELGKESAYFLLRNEQGAVGVKVSFGKQGCWHAFPFVLYEDCPPLAATFETRFKVDGYTTELMVDAPEDTEVSVLTWDELVLYEHKSPVCAGNHTVFHDGDELTGIQVQGCNCANDD